MPLSKDAPLAGEYKLFTALGFGVERADVNDLLDEARRSAFTASERTAKITLNGSGQAIVDSTVNGQEQQQATVSFADSKEQMFPMGKSFDVNLSLGGNNVDGHVLLTMGIFGGSGFHITADGKKIDGDCQNQGGLTVCKESVRDAAGKEILQVVSSTDIGTSPHDFTDDSRYYRADKYLGETKLHVLYDEKKNSVVADSVYTPPPGSGVEQK